MTLVHSQQLQHLTRFSPQSTHLGSGPCHDPPVPSHRRARLACDLAAAGADGAGAVVKLHRAVSVGRASRTAEAEGRGGYSAAPGRLSQEPPARRRLMGLGDKTATTRRPELAAQTTRAERQPSSKRYFFHLLPGEGPALRPALHTFAAKARGRSRLFDDWSSFWRNTEPVSPGLPEGCRPVIPSTTPKPSGCGNRGVSCWMPWHMLLS